jgi:hypothetical protein
MSVRIRVNTIQAIRKLSIGPMNEKKAIIKAMLPMMTISLKNT